MRPDKKPPPLRRLYLIGCILGAAVPLSPFIPWLLNHGLDIFLFAEQPSVNAISRFFALDVVISALVLTLFIVYESRRLQVNRAWLAILATFCVGVSLGLPLFLYLRQGKLDANHHQPV